MNYLIQIIAYHAADPSLVNLKNERKKLNSHKNGRK